MVVAKGFQNTFNKGIDMDTSVNKRDNYTYYEAVDMRIINREALSSGSLVNVDGNKETINLGDDFWEVKNTTTIDDTLVLFCALNSAVIIDIRNALGNGTTLSINIDGDSTDTTILFSGTNDDSYMGTLPLDSKNRDLYSELKKHGSITNNCNVVLKDNKVILSSKLGSVNIFGTSTSGSVDITNSDESSGIFSVDDYSNSDSLKDLSLIYSGDLGFAKAEYVSVSSRYESASSRKIYWANGSDPLRFLDIDRSYSGNDPSDFDHIRNFKSNEFSSNIEVEERSGGSLLAGKYQYAIQYISKEGSSTTFSATSRMISIDKYGESEQAGSASEEMCNKSVLIRAESTPDEVSTYRILSLYYSSISATPIINILEESQASGTIVTIDNGTYEGSITLEEFRTFNINTINPKLISNKDNIMFAANLKDDLFFDEEIENWDSRAYGFDTFNGNAFVFDHPESINVNDDYSSIDSNGDGINYTGGVATPFTDWNHDKENAFNRDNELFFNDLSAPGYAINPSYSSGAPISGYLRNEDGYFYGHKGKNVSILFREAKAETVYGNKFSGSKDRVYDIKDHDSVRLTECQPDDVYRIGIVFFNDKGQSSFVKWIADIRMPYDMQYVDYSGISRYDRTYTYSTGVIEVAISNAPDYDWQLVRVKRNSSDKTIRTRGLIQPLMTHDDYEDLYKPYMYGTTASMLSNYELSTGTPLQSDVTIRSNFVDFISSDTKFNNQSDLNYNGSKLILSHTYKEGIALLGEISGNYDGLSYPKSLKHIDNNTNITAYTKKYSIIDSSFAPTQHFYADVDQNEITIGGVSYVNQFFLPDTTVESIESRYPSRCSGLILAIDDELSITDSSGTNDELLMGYIISDNDISRYGGYSKDSRLGNEYIEFSKVYSSSTTIGIGTYGDIHHTIFNFVRALFNSDANTRKCIQAKVDIFSSSQIDCDRRIDKLNKYYSPVSDTYNANNIITKSFIQETVAEGILLYPDNYNENIGDLYIYNPVYSSQGGAKVFFQKPDGFESITDNNIKVASSQSKLNGELQDSWLTFLVSDFIELDGSYGPINGLQSFKSNLVFFQEDAVGLLSVNERSLISDSSGRSLSLGSGGVLERYDYISYNSGIVTPLDLITSKSAMYFIDENSKSFSSIAKPDESITKMAGIDSFFFDNIIKGDIRTIGFDVETNEILINCNEKTICYNEITQAFTSIYDINPHKLIRTPKKLLSQYFNYDVNTNNYLYAHNDGEKGSWYPGLKEKTTSSVALIINPNGNIVNYFDNLDLRTNVFNRGENAPIEEEIVDETVSRIGFENSYIPTIYIESANSGGSAVEKIKRLARAWKTQVPLTENGNRLVDTYLTVILEFDNNEDKLFKLHDVITYFRQTNY